MSDTPVIWTEHRNSEGRTYWYNAATKDSVWEKPEALKTPFERALAQTPWKEYFQEGRKYYYNTVTKQSKWDMPEELLLILERVEQQAGPLPPPISSNLGLNKPPAEGANQTLPPFAPPANVGNQTPMLNPLTGAMVRPGMPGPLATIMPLPSSLPQPVPQIPARPSNPDEPVVPTNGFSTHEEAEKAFWYLLKKAGITPELTWDNAIRGIITDPLYKSFNSMAERKESWQKYIDTLKTKEAEEKEARMNKQRPAIRNMLKGNPNVFHYTSFETADQIFAQHPIWQQVRIEAERRQLFREYIQELQQREQARLREMRGRNMEKVVNIFKLCEVDALTRWQDAYRMVVDSDQWKEDEELSQLPQLDILLAFEDYSKIKSGEYEAAVKAAELSRMQRNRVAREAFRALLDELKSSGKLTAGTKWKEVYPLFATDERYLNLLGLPGSTPLELFWDTVDQMDLALAGKVKEVEKYLADRQFQFTEQTTLEDLSQVLKEEESLTKLVETDGTGLYRHFREQAAHQRRKAEKHQRRLQDDLRHALKRKAHKIDIDAPYEEIVPVLQDLPEFRALENDDDGRRTAFSKFVKRQKEKIRETHSDDGSTSSRKRKEPYGSRHERERDKSKDRDSHKDRDDRYNRHRERDRDRERDRERDYSGSKRRDERERDRERKGSRREDDKDRDRTKKKDEDVEMKDVDKESPVKANGASKVRADSPEEGEI